MQRHYANLLSVRNEPIITKAMALADAERAPWSGHCNCIHDTKLKHEILHRNYRYKYCQHRSKRAVDVMLNESLLQLNTRQNPKEKRMSSVNK